MGGEGGGGGWKGFGRGLESFCSSASEVSDLQNPVLSLVCSEGKKVPAFPPRLLVRCAPTRIWLF